MRERDILDYQNYQKKWRKREKGDVVHIHACAHLHISEIYIIMNKPIYICTEHTDLYTDRFIGVCVCMCNMEGM